MQPNKSKATLQLVIATLLSLFGILLLGAAFVTAPPGEIHSSVLIAYGEVMTFAGALFGIIIYTIFHPNLTFLKQN